MSDTLADTESEIAADCEGYEAAFDSPDEGGPPQPFYIKYETLSLQHRYKLRLKEL